MKKFSFFQTLIGSFFNPQTYRDTVTFKKGNTFGYLALLVLLCSIPLMIAMISGIGNFMKSDGKFIVDQVPELTFKNGVVTMDKESPYFIKTKKGETIIVIDLSDSSSISELQGTAKVLLTKDKLIALQNESETRTYDISKIQDLKLNAQKIYYWLGFAWIFYVIIFVFIVIFFYIYRIVQALFNALLGLIISTILNIKLDYSSLIYISMVAITPVAIIASVLWATDLHIPAKGWLGFILTIGFITFGILANKPQPAIAPIESTPSEPQI